MRLFAATGNGIARLDETGDGWAVELFLTGSGAQCLAVDPADPDTVYAGLREGGVRRTTGPRLLKLAMLSRPVFNAPTV